MSAVGVDVLLTGWSSQQWVLMSYWQGYPVSSGCWCLINRVTLSAVSVDVLLTGSPCQQWVLMSYWQGNPVSNGCWCLIDRVTLSAVGLDVLLTHVDRITLSAAVVDVLLTVWPCQQWVLMSFWQHNPVSSGCSCHRILSVWVIIDGLNSPNFGWLGRSPELQLLGLPKWMQPYWVWAYLWLNEWCTSICSSNVLAEEYTKFYLMARFEVFQRLIPLFPLREGCTSLYSRSLWLGR